MFGWFKKKVPLEVGQQWAWDQENPFENPFIVEIVGMKSGWIQYKLWAEQYRCWTGNGSLKEWVFRGIHKRLLTESERVGTKF